MVVVVLVVAPKINILDLSGELQEVGVGGWWVQTFHDIQWAGNTILREKEK